MTTFSGVVGILGLQGCVDPHRKHLDKLNVSSLLVRDKADLASVKAIILPGGESSTMLKLLKKNDLFDELKTFVQSHPTWGICAGAILLAKKILNPSQDSLGVIPLQATRNYYGSQLDSFKADLDISKLSSCSSYSKSINVDFIRAPFLEVFNEGDGEKDGEKLCTLATYKGHEVLYRYGDILASSFHTELGDDSSMHKYFIDMIK